jgi:hypothetical protein
MYGIPYKTTLTTFARLLERAGQSLKHKYLYHLSTDFHNSFFHIILFIPSFIQVAIYDVKKPWDGVISYLPAPERVGQSLKWKYLSYLSADFHNSFFKIFPLFSCILEYTLFFTKNYYLWVTDGLIVVGTGRSIIKREISRSFPSRFA